MRFDSGSWFSIVPLLALLAAVASNPAYADAGHGELYGYALGEIVEGCGLETAQLDWSRAPARALTPPFEETWLLCTPLTHEVLSISARAHVTPAAGRELVDELVALISGKYESKNGWKHDTQSRELLGIYDAVHSFENEAYLLRVSKRNDGGATDGRSSIVELQLDRSTYAVPRRDANERAEKERQEILRRAARAKGLDKGL